MQLQTSLLPAGPGAGALVGAIHMVLRR